MNGLNNKTWSGKVNKVNCKCENEIISWNMETIALYISIWL